MRQKKFFFGLISHEKGKGKRKKKSLRREMEKKERRKYSTKGGNGKKEY